MYLSVQLAARRLGVSPHTIRRWTASGFLPCTRTAGGHRRIKQEDIDELTHLIGGRNHLAARLARERELETLVSTAIAVSSQLDLPELLREVARQMTSLLECHFCAISEYDPETRKVRVLADYDDLGNRVPDSMTYTVHQFPMAKRALEDHEPITVNVSDPHADAAEVAIMRRDGDKCLLILPMVYQDRAIGLLEVLDHHRERRFSRQEMRLARALAGQAAVALHNAKVFAQLRESDAHTLTLRTALERVTAAYTELVGQPSVPEVLQHAAAIGARALGGLSCVASCGPTSAGASGVPADTESRGHTTQTDSAHVVVASAPCGDDRLVLTLTLADDAGEGQAELLSLIATAAAGAVRRLSAA
ncbi:MAG: GAF domain-containing protein [Thermoleophilia bacterium]|nr:GAF domain-containing protein [Thermoleophilia bacterium]